MNIESRDLRYFEVIAQTGHLREASEVLHLSQPALSKCVNRLEAAVGAALFERAGRGIQLTAVGKALLQQARNVNLLTANALREVQQFAAGDAGLVRIGCGPVMAELLLPSVCALVHEHLPQARVVITVGMNYALREELKQGQIDVILGMVAETSGSFISHRLIRDTVVVAANPGHRLFRKRRIDMADLVEDEWVLPIPAVTSRLWLDRQFSDRGLPPPQARMEVNATPLLLPMIARSSLLCFVSRHILARQAPGPHLDELPVQALSMHRWLGMTLMSSTPSPVLLRFVELLRGHPQLMTADPIP